MNTEQSYSEALTKLLSSELITKIYPIIDKIDVYYSEGRVEDRIDLYILLNDSSINQDNMYIKDFDPHYLVDKHVRDIIPFLGIDRRIKIFTHLLNPKGREFYFFDY